MEPLAKYEEQRIAGRRSFRLFSDRISITGKEYLGGEYAITVSLSGLDTAVDRMTGREPIFNHGLYLFCGGVLADFIVVSGLKVERFTSLSSLAIGLALTGLVMVLASWRQREWVVLKNRQGQPVANLSCGLRQQESFGRFLENVRTQTVNFQSAENTRKPDGQA